jgi:hypothetical protein
MEREWEGDDSDKRLRWAASSGDTGLTSSDVAHKIRPSEEDIKEMGPE